MVGFEPRTLWEMCSVHISCTSSVCDVILRNHGKYWSLHTIMQHLLRKLPACIARKQCLRKNSAVSGRYCICKISRRYVSRQDLGVFFSLTQNNQQNREMRSIVTRMGEINIAPLDLFSCQKIPASACTEGHHDVVAEPYVGDCRLLVSPACPNSRRTR